MNRIYYTLIIFGFSILNLKAQNIDLNNWKITIPVGKPASVEPPEILNFEEVEKLKPFFYRDTKDSALVFYAYPAESTRNSKYSRTELREQMEPGSNKVNWTFEDGANMRGTLSVPSVSQNEVGNYHRVIIMQIHGRLTDQQRDLIGEDDNNAPPILKIYWDQGRVRVKTKVLKNHDASDEEILHESAWGDDKGRNFKEVVGNDKFTLEVNVVKGKMTVTLNDAETFTYDGVDIERWGVFENYFKAGNYFQSRDEGSFAYVKYYDLKVRHDNINKGIKLTNEIRDYQSKPNSTNVDLTPWSLELPTGYKASDWKLSNFENDKFAISFFYADSINKALVMEAFPAKGTSKAKYTRNTLKQVRSKSGRGWTQKQGGSLEAEFQVMQMSKDENGKYHRTLLFQIEGRTTAKQTAKLGLSKPQSMPYMKVFWQNGKIRVTRRELKDELMVGDDLLLKNSWKESEGVWSKGNVDFDRVKIKILFKKGKLLIQVNEEKPIVYRDLSVSQWYFENTFLAGNYLQSKESNAHSIVKFYNLSIVE